jgi:ATP-dependent Clp protease adapter protein ClpS
MSEQTIPIKNEDKLEDKAPKRPEQYSVVLLNSDYAEFMCVLISLQDSFCMNTEKAMYLTQQAHMHGEVCIATYSKDIAESKAEQAYNALKHLHEERGLDAPSAIYQAKPYTEE